MHVKLSKLTFWIDYPFKISFKIKRKPRWWNKWTVLTVEPMPKENKKGGWIWYWGCFYIRYSDW